MGFYKVLPKNLGHGEGGSGISQLEAILNSAGQDLDALFVAGTVNTALRQTRGSNETKYDVSGVIVDEAADPVEGAVVQAFIAGQSFDEDYLCFETGTLSDGTFSVAVYPGSYDFRVVKTGYTTIASLAVSIAADKDDLDLVVPTNLQILATVPAADATGVQPTSTIDIVFDRAITDNSGGYALDGITVTGGTLASWARATTNVANDTMRLTLSAPMAANTEFTVELESADTVIGSDDELLAADFEFEFTSGATHLTFTAVPVDEGADIASTDTITLTFDANISDNSGTADIKDGLTVLSGATELEIDTAVIANDDELVITLVEAIPCQGQDVTVTVNKLATVKRTSDSGVLAANTSIVFTMAAYLEVSSVEPVNGFEGVASRDTIVVTFDRNVADNSGDDDLEDLIQVFDGGVAAPITSAVIADAVLTITLTSTLDEDGQTIIATLPLDCVKGDTDGALMEEDYIITFIMVNTPA